MEQSTEWSHLMTEYTSSNRHSDHDYFAMIKELVALRNEHQVKSLAYMSLQEGIDLIYDQILNEISTNRAPPISPIKFGTSGWRGIIGKDIYAKTVQVVTCAIVDMYNEAVNSPSLSEALGVADITEAKRRGAVIGFDNRFGNELFSRAAIDVLTSHGFTVYYAGEATTGTLSAAVMELQAAFSFNFTPSHNPLEYGGFKFNAADAGPAQPIITNWITARANTLINNGSQTSFQVNHDLVKPINALEAWTSLVHKGESKHGLNYEKIMGDLAKRNDFAVVVDSVHGASRVHVKNLFKEPGSDRLHFLRNRQDYTFGGITPEPSPDNMLLCKSALSTCPEPLKLGIIMDPDADRIRFTDGQVDINMNQFGAMAYHFLHKVKGKTGLVGKTVATSNFANAMAVAFNEEVFEPRVGFKEFKPVIDKALVCFEESDGITVIGHTPEKDAYIGLLLALDMTMTLEKNLGEYLTQLQEEYGLYVPDKDGVAVSQKGEALTETLSQLSTIKVGDHIMADNQQRLIKQVIDIDGYKIILDNGSWLMIRPSGTEPKVRFYVEARSEEEKSSLFKTAQSILADLGL